jgi:ABC-type Fe3+/spermidine/putrescine transport system ATPase subunit
VVQVMIRPEQIRVTRRNGGAGAGGVAAKVVGRSFYGPDTLLRLELADSERTPVTARVLHDAADEAGDEVALAVEGPVAVYTPEGQG